MCIEGQEMSSVALSQKMQQLAARGASQLTFLIGSSFGLDEDLKKKADLRLSMSPMTFPHHLARVMLLEQIYAPTRSRPEPNTTNDSSSI